MNKFNLLLIASPSEFAAIFGEVTSDAVPEARAHTTGLPQGATAVTGVGSARRNEPRDSQIAKSSRS